ncbi:MAG: LacI family transcriptional regulator [Devosia sp. 67-54]|uniref:LacI family DNA-binding transcriptional regulator n=1 Tax=unclassified Devosia TaxID=196773 RepID=UPI0009631CDB|nr:MULTISPECIES: LacI family DNA-binding transcriptional regulator [unclassified Devosia]MBN9305572.1 LacI family DNA-binding transcriptional regulator [Devosia sp.]OJX19149.1 MAG: LacI family transcriptional regulator [Devosia sp. 67-54]
MVARTANVSRVAVSRAFNPHASIKPAKRDMILRVAQELNYTPDRAARSMVTGRSHLVGVIVPDVCSPWESQEIDALTTALQAEGFATLLFKTRIDLSMDETLLTYMKGYNPDSVIAFTENVRPQILSRVLDRAVPIYVVYGDDDGAGDAPGGPLTDRLRVVQRTGIEQAVALMQGYGARRIAFLSGVRQSLATVEREKLVRRVLAERGLPPPVLMAGDYTYDTAYRETLSLFRVQGGVDAVFAANDVGAFGVMDALRHELGRRVPEDVQVVGFDDILQAHWKSYNLTTVKIDLIERVQAFVRLILARLRNPGQPALTETIVTRLVVRGTVG